MDDDVRGQEQQQEQKGGMAETDRRTLLRTAGLAGAAGAALAGTMHGKFSLAPITTAQAQTATSMPKGVDKPWWPRNGARTTRPALPTTSRRRRSSMR
jgi:hypothetical protein